MDSRKSRVTIGTIVSYLQFIVQLILQLSLAPVILHIAGKETLGAYAILLQMISHLGLADLGMGTALNRFLSHAYGLDDQLRQFRRIFVTGRTFLFISNIAVAILVAGLSRYVGVIFSLKGGLEHDARISLYLLSVWIVLRTSLSVYNAALMSVQKLGEYNVIALGGGVMRLVLSLALVFTGAGLVGLMIANILAEALTFISYRWRFKRSFPAMSFPWNKPDREILSAMLSFGFSSMIYSVGTRLTYNSDNIIVGYLFGAAGASLYYSTQAPAMNGYSLLWKLPQNASPAIAELNARDAKPSLQNSYYKLSRYVLFLAFPLSLGIFCFNRSFVSFWVGAKQYAGDMMTVALSLFPSLTAMTCVNGTYLFGSGKIVKLAISTIVAGTGNIFLSLWLGRHAGPAGVMISSVIAEGAYLIYTFHLVSAEYNIAVSRFMRESLLPALASVLIVVPAAFMIFTMQRDTVELSAVLRNVTVFALLWMLGVWFLGLDSTERKSLGLQFGIVPRKDEGL